MSVRLVSATKLRLRASGVVALTTGPASVPAEPTGPSATAIAAPTVTADRVYQRNGTSKTITFAGTYTGTAALIQARVVDAASAAQVTAWATLDAAPTGGNYTGTINVPQGGWYKVQVRDGNNNAITATSSNKFGVGAIVALIGQSNMVHLSDATTGQYPLSGSKARRFPASHAWERVGNYNDALPPNTLFGGSGYSSYTGVAGGDGVIYFTNYLSAALGVPVAVLEYAVIGSAIASWQPGSGGNWATFSSALTAAGNDCEAAIWYQGEDNSTAHNSTAYQASLLNVLSGLRTQTGRNATTFAFGVVTLGPTIGYAPEGGFGAMRATQLAFIAANAGTFLAGVAGDSEIPSNESPPVHIIATSQARMGKRYAKSLAAYFAGTPKPGPKITGATYSGATMTVATTGALKDGAGGNGASALGFRVTVNGAAATISSTALVGGAPVLTLASAPPAGAVVTLDYAMANLPFGVIAPPLNTMLYDSDTVPGDTLGLPLQPCAAFTVTGS